MEGEGEEGDKSGHQNISPLCPSLWVEPNSRPVQTNQVATHHMWLLSIGTAACH